MAAILENTGHIETSQNFISIYVSKIWSLDDYINFAKLRFSTICWHFLQQIFTFPGSLSRPSLRLAAILELSDHWNGICRIIFFFLHAQIYLLSKQNTIFGLSVAILWHNDITWYAMAAILDIGSHIERIWTFDQCLWHYLNICYA